MPFTFQMHCELILTCEICGKTESFLDGRRERTVSLAKYAGWRFSTSTSNATAVKCPAHPKERKMGPFRANAKGSK
ncbi:MAG: hypothetical protein NVSMB64_26120 [Candidatus Velthaea sp.]